MIPQNHFTRYLIQGKRDYIFAPKEGKKRINEYSPPSQTRKYTTKQVGNLSEHALDKPA